MQWPPLPSFETQPFGSASCVSAPVSLFRANTAIVPFRDAT